MGDARATDSLYDKHKGPHTDGWDEPGRYFWSRVTFRLPASITYVEGWGSQPVTAITFLGLGGLMSFFTALVTSKIAATALAAGTLAVGGTAAAAYTGTLPTPLQESAHNLIGAPAPAAVTALAAQATGTATAEATATATAAAESTETAEPTETAAPSESPSATPAAVDATGPAAYGLCQSFTNGGLDASSTAYKSLTVAANGETNIATYCATVASPGESASHRPAETGAAAAAAHIPADAAAHIPAAPQQAAQAVVPAAPAQAVAPSAPQQAEAGTAHKPATAGRP